MDLHLLFNFWWPFNCTKNQKFVVLNSCHGINIFLVNTYYHHELKNPPFNKIHGNLSFRYFTWKHSPAKSRISLFLEKSGQRIVCETQVAKDSHRNSREALCVACAKTRCGFLCPLLCSKRKPCIEIAPTHRSAERNYYAKGKKRTIGLIVTPHYTTVFRTKKFGIGCKFGVSYILRVHGNQIIIFFF